MNKADTIDIRLLHTIEELNEVRKLESSIWGEEDSIPTHQTITAVKNGGLVLGAYFRNKLVGFLYSFPGYNGKDVYLCSHVLATDKGFRNLGIGEKLKLAEREEALKLGYSLISWTYDPLEAANGNLYIAKLGGVCSTYIPNCYGDMEDLLNRGIPSDRFLVQWYINKSDRNGPHMAIFSADVSNESSLIQWRMEEDLPVPLFVQTIPKPDAAGNLFVPIPKNYRTIRETNQDAAMDWRFKTREVFTNLFQQGWMVTGFKKTNDPGVPFHIYVLSKQAQFCKLLCNM